VFSGREKNHDERKNLSLRRLPIQVRLHQFIFAFRLHSISLHPPLFVIPQHSGGIWLDSETKCNIFLKEEDVAWQEAIGSCRGSGCCRGRGRRRNRRLAGRIGISAQAL
jgi:hypothetical protein